MVELARSVKEAQKSADGALERAAAHRAADWTDQLRSTLKAWHHFYAGYDPVFTWWMEKPWKDADRKLADAMSSYWANFAATGNPNGKGLEKWPAYEAKSDPALIFGDQVLVRNEVNKAALDFFDRFFAAQQ